MATRNIILRQTKGRPLTYEELDGNLQGLDTDLTQAEADIASQGERLTTAQGGIATNADDIAAQLLRIISAEGRLTTNESQIADNDGRIANAEHVLSTAFTTSNCTITTNANGTSIRFLNGLQICYKAVSVGSIDINIAAGSLFRSDNFSSPFPQPFVGSPACFYELIYNGTSAFARWVTSTTTSTTTGFRFAFLVSTSVTNTPSGAFVFSIGTWK